MKCQHCEKPATFHITELIGQDGPVVVHLCEEHARAYLSQENSSPETAPLVEMLAKQLQLDQTVEQMAKLDKKSCPVCGISFAEFRQQGRLGCAYDYVIFREDLQPLLVNIHGAKQHIGKRPSRMSGSPQNQHRLIQLRREMKVAVEQEDYERASQLRDEIRDLERSFQEGGDVGTTRSDEITDTPENPTPPPG
jgi:protein arginine kinase activator